MSAARSWIVLALLAGSTLAAERQVALTFDDLPRARQHANLAAVRHVTRRLLSTLSAHKIHAIGFVNESKLHVPGEVDARAGILKMWLDAGMTLGNHTFSHPNLDATPSWQYEDDIIRGEVITRRLLQQRGQKLVYFRHPFTHTGATREARDRLEAFLKLRGYVVAPFTVENADYLYNDIYERALGRGDRVLAERVRAAYLDHFDAAFRFFEDVSRSLLGYELPQILLIHANQINAECLEEMIQRLKRHGYAFISLDQALADKAYRLTDGYIGTAGPSWLHRWAVGMGRPSRLRDEPDPPRFIMDLYRARQP